MSSWIDSITFPSSDEPFKPLAPASKQKGNKYQWIDHSSIGLEEPLDNYIERDPFPIPSLEEREGYYSEGRHFDWWLSGLKDLLKLRQILKQHAAPVGAGSRLLELGCASGRVLRHSICQFPEVETWGCDIKLRHIEWMRKFLPANAMVFQNTIYPSLPIESNYLDALAAYSVFTHIDELEGAWLCELRRILKPGGIACISIHGDHCWSRLGPDIPVYTAIMKMRKHLVGWEHLDEALFESDMPHEKTVFKWSNAQSYNSNVFHSTKYLKSYWGRFFDILEIIPSGHEYQDLVVIRKPV